MQLKLFLAYLTCAAVLAVANTVTPEVVVNELDNFDRRAAVLRREFDAINSDTSILDLWAMYNEFGSMLAEIEGMTNTINALSPGSVTVSAEECTQVLDAIQNLQPVVESGLKALADKKPVFDTLAGSGRVSTMAGMLVMDARHTQDNLEAALFTFTPDHCMAKAQSLADTYHAAFDPVMTVYH